MQSMQQSENVSYVCFELNPSDYIENKRFIDSTDTIVLFFDKKLKQIFRGPQVVNLEEYHKKSKNNDYSQLKLFKVRDEILSSKKITYDFSFSSHDFHYRIPMSLISSYTFKISIGNYENFISLIKPNKEGISFNRLTELVKPKVEYSIQRCILSTIKEKNTSLIYISSFLTEINKKINIDANNRLNDYGLSLDFVLKDLDYKDTESTNELRTIILKAKEMEILKYTYQEENLTDYLVIVDDQEGENK